MRHSLFYPIMAKLYTMFLVQPRIKMACAAGLFILCSFQAFSQYEEVSDAIGINYENLGYHPSGFSAVDFNDDGWDDLTIGTHNNGIYFYQNNNGIFEEVELLPFVNGMVRSVQWIDMDGDGDLDFFANRHNSFPVMFRNDGDLLFSDVTYMLTLPDYAAGTSSVSWGDYNRDGLLDAYFCNYYMMGNITNWLLRNDGEFNFTDVTEFAGVGDSIKTSYQAMWIDYDLNGWIDLYVSNDRLDGNAMYRNLGDGTFELVDHASGLNVVLDGMGINFDDYDNDLDYDLYIANTENGSMLLRQDDGVYIDVADTLGVDCPHVVSWGVQWTDAANDGWNDLYVVNDTPWYEGNQNYFFYQTEPGSFQSDVFGDFAEDEYESYACGEIDVNNDGYMDIVNVNQYPPDVQIWRQDTGVNNWIKIELNSEYGNWLGVGANIMVFFGEQKRLRSTHVGESFLAQNPYYETFGIGDASAVDSVAVLWPSGEIQMYYDLTINTTNLLNEGPPAPANDVHAYTLCQNDSVMLYPGVFAEYQWSDNSQQSFITVSDPGVYDVVVTNLFGYEEVIQYTVETGLQNMPEVVLSHPVCHGDASGSVGIELVEGLENVQWLDGASGFSRTNLNAGLYPYFLTDINGCNYYGAAEITQPDAILISLTADTVCPGEHTQILTACSGGTGELTQYWGNTNPLFATEGLHLIEVMDQAGCNAVDSIAILAHDAFNAVITAPMACYGETAALAYEATGSSGYYQFDFDEVNPEAVLPGEYLAVVSDEHLCSQIIPYAVIENAQLFAELSFDENCQSVMAQVSGGTPPYNYLWSDGSSGESLIASVPGSYQCTITDVFDCTTSTEIIIEVGVDEVASLNLRAYPLPAEDFVVISTSIPSEVKIYDAKGAVTDVLWCYGKLNLEIAHWPAGFYLVVAGSEKLLILKK